MHPRLVELGTQVWHQWSRRIRIAASVASLQLLVQAVSALTGFLLVRNLSKDNYAWFTIATTMSAILSNIGDSGAQTGLLSAGGKIHSDNADLSSLISTAMRLRYSITALVWAAVAPVTIYLLIRNGASSMTALTLVVLVTLGAGSSSAVSIFAVANQLTGRYNITQMVEFTAALCRLAGSATAVIFLPLAGCAVAATSLSQWVNTFLLRKNSTKFLNMAAPQSAEHRKSLMAAVRYLWFPILFATFQTQLATWILSFAGSRSQVADLGAIGRFAALFSIMNALIHITVAPTFARCNDRLRLVKMVAQAFFLLGLGCGSLVLAGFLLPQPFLWVLGPQYKHLSSEIGLFFVLSSIGCMTALIWALVSAKAWIQKAWLIPPVTLAVQVISAASLDVTFVAGALWLMIISSLPPLLVTLGMAFHGLRRLSDTRAAP